MSSDEAPGYYIPINSTPYLQYPPTPLFSVCRLRPYRREHFDLIPTIPAYAVVFFMQAATMPQGMRKDYYVDRNPNGGMDHLTHARAMLSQVKFKGSES